MTPPNNGQFAIRFEEHSNNFYGSKTSAPTSDSQMTVLRQQAMQNIYDLAQKKGVPLDDVITGILKNSDTELKTYIQSKGETPVPDVVGRAIQATMLRAADVATTGAILDVDDENALKNIEAAETDIVNSNSPDQDSLLTIPTQAAIACAMQYASEQSGGKTMGQIVNGMNNLAKNIQAKANNDDGSDDISDWLDWTDDGSTSDPVTNAASTTDVNLSPTSVSSSLATIPVTPTTSVAAGIPTISSSASTAAQVSSGTGSQGGVLNSISGILSGISSVASQVSQTAKTVTASGTTLSNAFGNLGASSISQYIQNNLPMVIIIVIALFIVIFVALRGRK